MGKPMSPISKGTALALAFLFLIPAIGLVAAPKPNGPTISTPSISPSAPTPTDTVRVTSTVTAGGVGVQNVSLVYTTAAWHGTNTTVLASYNSTSQLATMTIPHQQNGTRVQYFIVAYDNNSIISTNDNNGRFFTYSVIGPPATTMTGTWIQIALVIIAVAAIVSVAIYALRPRHTTTR